MPKKNPKKSKGKASPKNQKKSSPAAASESTEPKELEIDISKPISEDVLDAAAWVDEEEEIEEPGGESAGEENAWGE